jgi:hypothetical protein
MGPHTARNAGHAAATQDQKPRHEEVPLQYQKTLHQFVDTRRAPMRVIARRSNAVMVAAVRS